jgi:hypothetical protein
VVIDYETFSKIDDCHDRQGVTIAQTAPAPGLDPQDGRHVGGASALRTAAQPAARQCP